MTAKEERLTGEILKTARQIVQATKYQIEAIQLDLGALFRRLDEEKTAQAAQKK